MDFCKVAFILVGIAVVSAIAPIKEFHVPKPYSFGYAIKDKHGEQHRQEVGDGLHNVKGSYGFKDERGIERQVNYVADKGGFRAEIKTNEPGTAALNPAAVKMESSAHPYFGTSKGLVGAGAAKEGLALASNFGYPGILKFDAGELAKAGLAFEEDVAKEEEFEKEALDAELAKEGLFFGTEFAKEGLAFPSAFASGLGKEAEVAKGLEELWKKGFAIVPIGMLAEKEAKLEKEGLALSKTLGPEEFSKLGLMYSPLFAKENIALGLKESELEKEGLAFGKLPEAFPLAPSFTKVPLPFTAPKPKGFAYGGPLLGGFVKGYDARLF